MHIGKSRHDSPKARAVSGSVALLVLVAWLRVAALPAGAQQDPKQSSGGLHGYISMDIGKAPEGFGAGVSFYTSVWPLLEKPLGGFQIGLPSTWITPDNSAYEKCLCPPGTVAKDSMPERGPTYRDVFQTIEGSAGFWVSTQFGSATPKYRMNSTPNCYSQEISSPGWGFGQTAALRGDKMGLAQLSNRMLVPPDGLTFKEGQHGELIGTAWMALPWTAQRGYFELQNKLLEKDGMCLEGNKPGPGAAANGAAFMSKSNGATGQLWRLMPSVSGYFRLQTLFVEKENLFLEGNKMATGSTLGGAAFMSGEKKVTGESWKLLPAGNGYFRLTTQFLEKERLCLEANRIVANAPLQGAAHMVPFADSPAQLWKLVGKPVNGVVPTGDQSWTFFLNAANYHGPVAFFVPETWSAIAKGYDLAAGRGLDALPGLMGGGAMEVNTVPKFESKPVGGVKYSRIPKILFPVDAQGRTVLMQDATLYSHKALYDSIKTWVNGDGPTSGKFNPQGAWAVKGKSEPISFDQGGKNTPMTGIDAVFQTKMFGTTFGLQWANSKISPKGVFPEYYKHENGKIVAVAAAEVPEATRLKALSFAAPSPATPYTAPLQPGTVWSSPGPKAGPFNATLNDGSKITYSWYRFADQPSLQHLNWSPAEKTRVQTMVEQIHSKWPVNGQYIPPPSSGSLATLDVAMLVTPPQGLEIGYVPIVTRQAAK